MSPALSDLACQISAHPTTYSYARTPTENGKGKYSKNNYSPIFL